MPTFRTAVRPDDVDTVERLIRSSGFFSEAEVGVARELVQANLSQGEEASGYHFIFLEEDGRTMGYTCCGPIACTVRSFDMYWIAVDDKSRGKGYGKLLLEKAEEAIASAGGERIYVETSSRKQYEPTRAFYANNGYHVEAQLADFYDRGDDKVIFLKVLGGGR